MKRATFTLTARDRVLELGTNTRLMGIVNVTPDSFYDGGRYLSPHRAVAQGRELVSQGADILDVGGESSRPGAVPVEESEELDRVLPVIETLAATTDALISVDTCKASVARFAICAGAHLVNDISAFRDPEMPGVVRETGAGVVLMHMRGDPQTMQRLPPSEDILSEIRVDLQKALEVAREAEIHRDRIVIDPGIGFGKTLKDNLVIIRRLAFLGAFDLPVMVGTSRKSFLGKILDLEEPERLMGTAASVSAAILGGAHIVRVHDVREMSMVARVTDAIGEAGT